VCKAHLVEHANKKLQVSTGDYPSREPFYIYHRGFLKQFQAQRNTLQTATFSVLKDVGAEVFYLRQHFVIEGGGNSVDSVEFEFILRLS